MMHARFAVLVLATAALAGCASVRKTTEGWWGDVTGSGSGAAAGSAGAAAGAAGWLASGGAGAGAVAGAVVLEPGMRHTSCALSTQPVRPPSVPT